MANNFLLQGHLKHLLFLDAMITHHMGMNHNAMDRSCVYDRFIDEVQSLEFDGTYCDTVRKYYNSREQFIPNPTHIERHPCIKHPKTGEFVPLPESCIKMGVDYEEMDVVCTGGYWESLEHVDEYVSGYATDKMVSFLLSKIYEDPNTCQSAQDQGKQEEQDQRTCADCEDLQIE